MRLRNAILPSLLLSLSACAQVNLGKEQTKWFMTTSMTPDVTALGAKKPGAVSDVRPAVRYVFEKTPQCRLEPKALNAFAHTSFGQWLLVKTSPCYITHEGQVIQVDMDSGKVVRIEQFDKAPVFVGNRVWVGSDGVEKMPDDVPRQVVPATTQDCVAPQAAQSCDDKKLP